MEKFTASNGLVLVPHRDGSVRWEAGFSPSVVTAALREFFLHERDQELGRWRWPENPDHVVYVSSRSDIRVFCESSGVWGQWHERELTPQEVARDELAKTAAAYLAAHPEPKPWHGAKPGEVWEVRLPLLTRACGVVARAHEPNTFVDPGGRLPGFSVKDSDIRSARRIWPEVSDG